MIECPICHVMNEDQAHFCSECGQRFNPSMQSGGNPASGGSQPQPAPAWQQAPQSSQPQGFGQPQSAPLNFGQSAPANQAPPSNPPDYGQNALGAFGQPAPAVDAGAQSYAAQVAPPQGYGVPSPPGFAAGQPSTAAGMTAAQPPSGYGASDFAAAPAQDYGSQPGGYPQAQSAPGFGESQFSQPPQGFAGAVPSLPPDSPAVLPPSEPSSPAFLPPVPESDHIEPPKPARPRLHSPMLGNMDDDADEPPAPSTAGKRGLRSPLLRGNDEDQPEDTSSQSKSKGRGLRSPLLGSDDDEPPAPRSGKGGKSGGLRSPLLGGADDVDDDPPLKPGAFPHRNRSAEPAHPVDEDSSAKHGKGLRSPLLGNSDDDRDEPIPRGRNAPSGNYGRRRLHSPVLDGTGEFDYDAYAAEDEQSYDEDDPNILRSPLLAARQKLPVEKPPQPAPEPVNRAPAQQAAPAQQQQIQQQSTPPAYVPLTAPAPSGSYAAPAPAYGDPFPQPPVVNEVPAPPAAPAPTPVSKSDHAPITKGRSALLPHSEDHVRVPLSIYDSGLRETIPGTIKSGPALVIVVPALIALAAKGFYLFELLKVPTIFSQTAFLVDYFGQIIVLLGLLIFGLSANKKY